jgi:phenylpropionate dioxygenase-like ring-hydroxylating dioxygenase large terminal subunit
VNAFLRNTWYVAAWSHELPSGTLLARKLAGQALVFWRLADGSITALEDRCVHRQAPLSRGRLEGDALRCGYHGLKFAPSGRCIEVPGMDAPPASACVQRYAVVEHRRWVMVWMGDDAAQADATRLPDNFSCDSPDWAYRPGYVHYDTPIELIADNLLDFSHLSYVHAATFGGGGDDTIARVQPQIERLPNGVRVRRDVPAVPPPAYYRPLWACDGLVDRWLHYDFVLPGTLLMHSGAQPAGMSAQEAERRGVGVRFHSCQALTPETQTSTHYFFMEAHRADRGDAAVTEGLYQGIVTAFAEDRATIAAQWRNVQLAPDRPMLPLHMDAALTHYRRIYAAALQAQTLTHPT